MLNARIVMDASMNMIALKMTASYAMKEVNADEEPYRAAMHQVLEVPMLPREA